MVYNDLQLIEMQAFECVEFVQLEVKKETSQKRVQYLSRIEIVKHNQIMFEMLAIVGSQKQEPCNS